MTKLLAGKHCAILGVANKRSIAWGIAQSLHREGAVLAFNYANDRLKENVVELVESLEGHADFPVLPCDITKDDEIRQFFATLQERWGKLDTLAHSVAFARQEDLIHNFVDVTRDGYMLAHDVSSYSLIPCARYAQPLLAAAGSGSIFTLTYMASGRVVPKYNVMAVAKAALECNVRYLAAELGEYNIRVNAISAGPIKTLAASAIKGMSKLKDIMDERSPLHRNVTQEEVGDVGLFLASHLSRAVTGEIIFVDNGYSIMGV